MNNLYIWITDILLMILTVGFFQILIPESSMAKYVKFIFSLLILAVILEPAVNLIEKLR